MGAKINSGEDQHPYLDQILFSFLKLGFGDIQLLISLLNESVLRLHLILHPLSDVTSHLFHPPINFQIFPHHQLN